MKLSETVNRKFEEVYNLDDYEVWTDTGWEDIEDTKMTIPYKVWELELADGLFLECADNHIVFDENLEEVFVKDLVENDLVQTEHGLKRVLSVKETDREENMYDLGVNSENRRYYTNNILSHNTQCTVGYLLWFALFHTNKTINITAQNEEFSIKILSRVVDLLENVPFFLQQGADKMAAKSLEFGNGSRIETGNSKGLRSNSTDLLFCDEFAFLPDASKFYGASYPTITGGRTESKIIITSTPDGMGNEFYNLWDKAEKGLNEYESIRWYWYDRPDRDESFKRTTIKNIGQRRWDTEYACKFLGASKTLIDGEVLETLTHKPVCKVFDSQYKLRCFHPPVKGHRYILTADVANGVNKDYSTFSIIDISQKPYTQVMVYQDNKISPFSYHEVILKWAKIYNSAFVMIENNNKGSIVCKSVYIDNEYENFFIEDTRNIQNIGVNTNMKMKSKGTTSLKELIEKRILEVNDEETIKELKVFEKKNMSFEAAAGHHDDLVMTLVIFAYLTTVTNIFSELERNDRPIGDVLSNLGSQMISKDILIHTPIMDNGDVWDGDYDDDDDDDGFMELKDVRYF